MSFTDGVTVDRVRAWLGSNGRSPKEHAIKVNLRAEIGADGE